MKLKLRKVQGLIQGHMCQASSHAQPYRAPNTKMTQKSDERPRWSHCKGARPPGVGSEYHQLALDADALSYKVLHEPVILNVAVTSLPLLWLQD